MPNSSPLTGTRPRVTVHFRDSANAGVDPSVLYFKVMDTEDNETIYTYGVGTTIVRDAAGDYHADVPVALGLRQTTGKYFCRWEAFDSSNVALAASEVVLEVNTRYPVRSTV
jgi:hypothetical protein